MFRFVGGFLVRNQKRRPLPSSCRCTSGTVSSRRDGLLKSKRSFVKSSSESSRLASSLSLQDKRISSESRTAILNSRQEDNIYDIIQEYAAQDPTPISLQDLTTTYSHENDNDNGKDNSTANLFRGRLGHKLAAERTMLKVAQMLWEELPIRLAHRIQDLDQIIMKDMPSVQQVKEIYKHSFQEIITTPPPQLHTEKQFATLLTTLYKKHSNVLLLMAKGASEFRTQILRQQEPSTTTTTSDGDNLLAKQLFAQQEECHHFLNRFYYSRVGIRVLAGQYLALRQQLLPEQQHQHYHHPQLKNVSSSGDNYHNHGYVGMICKHTSPYQVVQEAITNATRLCQEQYPGLEPPAVEIIGHLDFTFCYIPSHLHYMVLELLKNAMRATMEFHYDMTEKPPITVIIADGMDNEDVIIKVMDEGGGIPRSQMEYIWSYLFTTADPKVQERFLQQEESTTSTSSSHPMSALNHNHNNDPNQAPILAGLGYGLPMSRAYARYFGGDLDLLSMEGYGTDAFCHLVRLGDKAAPL